MNKWAKGSMDKIQVYHFYNGSGGGVLSVIKSLLQFSSNPLIENHLIHTINKDEVDNYPVNNLKGAVSEKIFYYSSGWNFYYTCTQLSKLLPDENAVIVTHDWLELGMVSNLGLQNPVITFLHGDYDYYYQLAQLHQAAADKFIVIANNMAAKLKGMIPERKDDICYLRFPVPSVDCNESERQADNIIFIGRLTKEKGYSLLPEIDKLLRIKNIFLNWHIVGEKNSDSNNETEWEANSQVKLYGIMNNEEVLLLLKKMKYFILPSLNEGMPVTLIEAMKAGVIPLVNNIEGGIQELVTDAVTGFKISNNEPAGYTDCISKLSEDKNLSGSISGTCIATANKLFDPHQNTRLIEDEICKTFLAPRKNKKAKKIYGSRLDQKWMPNIITKSVRGSN